MEGNLLPFHCIGSFIKCYFDTYKKCGKIGSLSEDRPHWEVPYNLD